MTPALALALVLAAAVLVALVRLLLRQRNRPVAAGRLALLMLLQPVVAALLYLTLVPPPLPTAAGTMTVLTAGATPELVAAQATGAILVAMPEAPRVVGAARMPDLATALRVHPGTVRLQVVGHGLDPRDRDAARGIAVAFVPPPLPVGLVRLDAAVRAAPGAAFPVAGRANALRGGRAKLLDPAGQQVDAADLDVDGRFHLHGHARAAGLADFTLQLLDAEGAEVESIAVPLHVADDPAPTVLLLSGAPNPEFQHLRRWAADAGLDLHVEVAVGGGVALGDGPAPASVDGFGSFDLVILDERVLARLGEARRSALAQALEGGTGVLLQVTGQPSPGLRGHMAALGMAVTDEAGLESVALPQVDDPELLRARLGPGSVDAPFDPALAQQRPPELTRRALRPGPGDAVPLAMAGAHPTFAWWRAQGRGRAGLWTLVDSHRLALAGRSDLHHALWSTAVAALARPAGAALPRPITDARTGRRVVICGLDGSGGRVVAPDGAEATIVVDPAAGPDQCAAYWPTTGGWHVLQAGEGNRPFHVRAGDSAPGAAAASLQEATLRLAGQGDARAGAAGPAPAPRRGPSWPWFTAWLAMAGLLWWLERRRPLPVGADPAVSSQGPMH